MVPKQRMDPMNIHVDHVTVQHFTVVYDEAAYAAYPQRCYLIDNINFF